MLLRSEYPQAAPQASQQSKTQLAVQSKAPRLISLDDNDSIIN